MKCSERILQETKQKYKLSLLSISLLVGTGKLALSMTKAIPIYTAHNEVAIVKMKPQLSSYPGSLET